jgi:hypothetical protein
LTAVGRVETSLTARSNAAGRSSPPLAPPLIPSTKPYAAATPIAGAPRTLSRRIASPTSRAVVQRSQVSSAGSLVWSSSSSASSCQRSGDHSFRRASSIGAS